MDFLEFFEGVVNVSACGADLFMAHECLKESNINSSFGKVGADGNTKGVRRNRLFDPSLFYISPYKAVDC